MPDEIPEPVPVVGLLVDVVHAGAQAGLEVVRVVAVGLVAPVAHVPGEGGGNGVSME